MLHSLFMKLAMLAATMGLVFWIGWQTPDSSTKIGASAGEPTGVPVHALVAAEPEPSRPDRFNTGTTAVKSEASHEANRGGSAVSGLLDVNRAGAKDFESLPGIGAVLAQRVIEYRTTVGRFQAIEDLRAVKGIGPKIFERIKPLVTVATVDVKGKAES